jgi:hypothetical protein
MLGLTVDQLATYDCAGKKVPDPLIVPPTTNAVMARVQRSAGRPAAFLGRLTSHGLMGHPSKNLNIKVNIVRWSILCHKSRLSTGLGYNSSTKTSIFRSLVNLAKRIQYYGGLWIAHHHYLFLLQVNRISTQAGFLHATAYNIFAIITVSGVERQFARVISHT